jgi:hypothetical protein
MPPVFLSDRQRQGKSTMKFTTGLKVAGFAAAFAFATVASAQTPGSSSAMAASGSPSYGTTTSGPTLPNALDTGGMAASPNATEQTGQPQANTAANNGISSNPSTYPADNGSASGSGSMGSSTGGLGAGPGSAGAAGGAAGGGR